MRTKRPPNSCFVNSYFSGCFKWNILDRYIDRLNGLYADGKYLFFTSRRRGKADIYWVDAKIIEDLKPKNLN